MCCKGVAATSCPNAISPICVCNCGGACHGSGLPLAARPSGKPRTISQGEYGMVQAIFILRLLERHHGRRGGLRGRPSRNARLRRWLKRAGIYWGHGIWSIQESMLEPTGQLAEELVSILNQIEDGEASGGDVPSLSPGVLREIEAIFDAMEQEDEETT